MKLRFMQVRIHKESNLIDDNLTFNQIAVVSQAKLVVKLSGGAKDAQSSKEGIYTLSLDTVNGKSYWMQEGGTSAIWFDKKYGNWKIGSKDNLGTSASGLYSSRKRNVKKPQDETIWNYYNTDNKTWIQAMEMRFT